jgi:hypothetical protein
MSISPWARGSEARAVRPRAGDRSLRRAGATSMMGFWACNRAEAPVVGQGDGCFYKWRDDEDMPLICPTCQNIFLRDRSEHSRWRQHVTLHGVVFDILVGGWYRAVRLRFRSAQAAPDTLRPDVLRVAAPRVALQGEAWWACLDSNQEPDRYERPALTIELQAPPAMPLSQQAKVRTPLTMWLAIRQCRGGVVGVIAREGGRSSTPQRQRSNREAAAYWVPRLRGA